MSSILELVHEGYVFKRRVRRLAEMLAFHIPRNANVLDVGCGNGELDLLIQQLRPDISISGIDILVRDRPHISVKPFDGRTIPSTDKSFDVVMFVDVLHHTDDPLVLMREAARVTRADILIKDHTANGILAFSTLRFMDRVGNKRHGVTLPYNYWPRQRWQDALAALKLVVSSWQGDLNLYPRPADWLFGRSLHFIARIRLGSLPAAGPDIPQEVGGPAVFEPALQS
ncbi:MAG: hypothetical protein NVSMB9_18480 [Isosphaeraceae bacterium]